MKALSVFIVVTAIAISPALPGEEGPDLKRVATRFKDLAAQIDGLDTKLRTNQLTRTEKLLEFASLSELIKEGKIERQAKKAKYHNYYKNFHRNSERLRRDGTWSEEDIRAKEQELQELDKQAEVAQEELNILELYEKGFQAMQAQEEGCPFLCTDNQDGAVTCGGIIYRSTDASSDI